HLGFCAAGTLLQPKVHREISERYGRNFDKVGPVEIKSLAHFSIREKDLPGELCRDRPGIATGHIIGIAFGWPPTDQAGGRSDATSRRAFPGAARLVDRSNFVRGQG